LVRKVDRYAVYLNAAATGTMYDGRGTARSGADNCSANDKPVLCLLPPSANDQRGEGHSLRLPIEKNSFEYVEYVKYNHEF
jgi:hypothetical protein